MFLILWKYATVPEAKKTDSNFEVNTKNGLFNTNTQKFFLENSNRVL
jgi:hypothetical protein